ncbi:MAG: hypothetical protein VX094_04115 [Bacteroidota bacterium]|nr:hypothetical protein [Bacteroidota bacterium]
MLKHIKLQFLFIASLIIITSCTKDDGEPIHEHEVNKVVLHFTNTADSSTFEVEWELEHDDEEHTDDDGDDHAHEGHIELAPNAEYTVEAKFYDVGEHDEGSDDHDHDHDGDHEEEGEDITPEIIEEKNVHHVFFEMVGLTNVTIVSASDDTKDVNGFGLNLRTTWTTGAEEKGEVKVFLIHEPGTKDGDTRAEFGGEDDVIADFEVHVELED